jgi:hypothetical protein
MLGISVTDNPLPSTESRLAFMKAYAENAGRRLAALRTKPDAWWEGRTTVGSRWPCSACWAATSTAATIPLQTPAA